MKTVIGISLGASAHDFEFTTTLAGVPLQVKRLGTDGSLAKAAKLIKHWDKKADAIGLGLLKDHYKAGAPPLHRQGQRPPQRHCHPRPGDLWRPAR